MPRLGLLLHFGLTFAGAVLLSGCYTTQQSIGTATFGQTYQSCVRQNTTSFTCLRNSPNFANFTDAEKALVAYMIVIEEKHSRGEITTAEAEAMMMQYAAQARATGAASERAQAAELSAALGTMAQGLNTMAAAQSAASPPPPVMPIQTRCWRSGMYVNCSSY